MIPQGLEEELKLRAGRIAAMLKEQSIDAILIGDNANLYYTAGRVFGGYSYITADGAVTYFVKRPIGLKGINVAYIRKPEQIAELLPVMPRVVALELDLASYSEVTRLSKVFAGARVENGSPIMRRCRSVKTEQEMDKIAQNGVLHQAAYSFIPKVYKKGMTDLELQIEMERVLRLNGCLGQFRICGGSMELFMGNVLCGDNADNPASYDFAMGGAGLDPSLPVGCNGTKIMPGTTVMVDMCGNFNGYMTDMTRSYYAGTLNPTAERAHQLSIDILHRIQSTAREGTEAKELYNLAVEMARVAGLDDYFMGHAQKAGFIGHGVGIEVNEAPVLAPRSRDVLTQGNVIAIEPKFVIPGVGAVGVENTYVLKAGRLECVTQAPEEIIELK